MTQKFYICLIMCKATPVEILVTRIPKKIRKESVVAESTRICPHTIPPAHADPLQLRKRHTIPTSRPLH